MTATQVGYGPAPTARRVPLVVPIDPTRGWAGADLPRRTLALTALPLAALLCVAVLVEREVSDAALWTWALVGPAAFYALARVLRPEPRSWERTPRHVLAGTATSYAAPVVAALAAESSLATEAIVIPFGSSAFLLGCTTVVWGLIALTVRLAQR